MKIIKEKITVRELREMAKAQFVDLVKAVVDVEQEIMAVGGELHADEEVLLMEKEGSKREHTWGINLYPEKRGKEFIEFDSMINLKPAFGNRSRGVRNPKIREKMNHFAPKAQSIQGSFFSRFISRLLTSRGSVLRRQTVESIHGFKIEKIIKKLVVT